MDFNAPTAKMHGKEALALELIDFSFSWNTPEKHNDSTSKEQCASKKQGASPFLFENVNLTLETGEFALLTGKTGSGKSTFLRTLKPEFSLAATCSGKRLVFGKEITAYIQEESASTIAYVQQDPSAQIVCDSVWHELAFALENLGISQDIMQQRVAEIANYFGIEKWFHKRCCELSEGQKQLLNLASALILRPRLLLLDEPTSMLDSITEKNFLHILFRINKELGTTIIVATHSADTMKNYATCELAIKGEHIKKATLAKSGEAPIFANAFLNAGTNAHKNASVPSNKDTTKNERATTNKTTGTYSNKNASAPSQTEASAPLNNPSPALCARDIYYTYKKGTTAVLKDCSLEVQAGQIHAIVGGNGSGKTTLIKLLAGIIKPRLGKISSNFKSKLGYLPQTPREFFVQDSVEEELYEWQHLAGYSQNDIEHIANKFNLANIMQKHSFDISQGQQQLVALAKITLCKPELLLLDEPSKGLDAETKLALAEILCSLTPQTTIVFATHDLEFAACIAQKLSFLFDGRIINTAKPTTFFENSMFYRPVSSEFSTLWEEKWET